MKHKKEIIVTTFSFHVSSFVPSKNAIKDYKDTCEDAVYRITLSIISFSTSSASLSYKIKCNFHIKLFRNKEKNYLFSIYFLF